MEVVEDAIILAAGKGTRMLPASLYMPKETMPLVDTPLINHLIWEAARSGVSRIHIVLSERKMKMLDGFFNGNYSISSEIRADLPRVSLSLGVDSVELVPYIQKSSLGVADAFSYALKQISGPFLVILGDNLVMSEHPSPQQSGVGNASTASSELIDMFQMTGLPAAGICKMNIEELSKYGVVKTENNLITEIIEKPKKEEAPSDYILCGRYLLPKNTAELLEMFPVSRFGEMQFIRILQYFMDNEGLNAVRYDKFSIFDSGDPLTWLKSQVTHALARRDLSVSFGNWLRDELDQHPWNERRPA